MVLPCNHFPNSIPIKPQSFPSRKEDHVPNLSQTLVSTIQVEALEAKLASEMGHRRAADERVRVLTGENRRQRSSLNRGRSVPAPSRRNQTAVAAVAPSTVSTLVSHRLANEVHARPFLLFTLTMGQVLMRVEDLPDILTC